MEVYCEVKRICYVGAGFVGTPLATVMAHKLPKVEHVVVDRDENRIQCWQNGPLPLHEPHLEELLKKVLNVNLFFSVKIDTAISIADVIFICVNTPFNEENASGQKETNNGFSHKNSLLPQIKNVLDSIVTSFESGTKIIVEKSTVPQTTAKRMSMYLANNMKENQKYQIVSNPEFCSEGNAINDLLYPDRVVLGCEDSQEGKLALKCIEGLYLNWVSSDRICHVSNCSAELSKLACNAFLAQRVSSINSISLVCEKLGGDIQDIVEIMKKDPRIGEYYLNPSLGFGGSCLRKDLCWLVYLCRSNGMDRVADYWQQVLILNQHRTDTFKAKILSVLNTYPEMNYKITIFGVTFKKNTSDTRDSASILLMKALIKNGVYLNVYDPTICNSLSLMNFQSQFTEKESEYLQVHQDAYDASLHTGGICICTEWDEFKSLDFEKLFSLTKSPHYIFDGRKLMDTEKLVKIGFSVYSIGSFHHDVSIGKESMIE